MRWDTSQSSKEYRYRLKKTGGVMLWKLHAAFPSVIWQIYDCTFNPMPVIILCRMLVSLHIFSLTFVALAPLVRLESVRIYII